MVIGLRQAREQINECIHHLPHDLDLRMEAAACALFLGQRDEAIRQYREALKIDQRPEIYLNLGNTLYNVGRREEAIEAFARLVSFTTFMVNYDRTRPWSGERVLDLIPAELREVVSRKADRERVLLAKQP
jgi:tetratricopeptide (TPR) repeat protein